jgi:hypothetical protein
MESSVTEAINMQAKRDQHKAGIPAKRRGQQMGYSGNLDKNRKEEEATPARLGRRPKSNKMAADVSAQNIGSDSVTPRTSSPSTPAMNVTPHGDGGEKVFKRRLAKQRSGK